jgi:hypothetical protein
VRIVVDVLEGLLTSAEASDGIPCSQQTKKGDYPLTTYDIGQELTVTGKIEDIGPDGILLVNCEIGPIST